MDNNLQVGEIVYWHKHLDNSDFPECYLVLRVDNKKPLFLIKNIRTNEIHECGRRYLERIEK